MRQLGLFGIVVAMLMPATASAQDWIEFEDRAWGVEINFPHEPTAEDIEYTPFVGDAVPARIYTGTTDTGRYTLTIASFASQPTDALTAVWHAANTMRAKREVTYFEYQDLDGIPGIIVSVTEPDGGLIQSGIYFVHQRLYIAEGRVAAGNPPPSNFQQSINIIDPAGNRIVPVPDD
jgi:hypothetical protein